jgi:hypothetical protein
MRRLLARLDRHWFAPASLRELALVRILVFGGQTLFFILLPNSYYRPLTRHIELASSTTLSYEPIAVLRLLLLPLGSWGQVRPGAELLWAAFAVAFLAGLLATVGLFSRVAMIAAALANTLIVAHWYSYGDHHHAEALMVIALNVLALSPCAAVWSLDAVRRRRAGRPAPPDASVFARWPLRLMQWTIALTYLSAAGSKFMIGGLQWFNGYTMMYHYLFLGLTPGHDRALYMATLPPWLHVVPSVFTFVFELTFFVAILVPRTVWWYVLAGIAFHLAIYLTMGIGFFQTMLLYVVFIESLRRHAPRALSFLRPGMSGAGIHPGLAAPARVA